MITTPHTTWAIGYDLDGTLVESFQSEPLPAVLEHLAVLKQRSNLRLFVVSNQAGPVYHAMFAGSAKFPTCDQLAERIADAATRLGLLDVPWFVATWHGNSRIYDQPHEIVGAWAKASGEVAEELRFEIQRRLPDLALHVSGSPHWRKPEWGMLEQAAWLLGVSAVSMIFVGDMETDKEAAIEYGAVYVDAEQWRSGEVVL